MGEHGRTDIKSPLYHCRESRTAVVRSVDLVEPDVANGNNEAYQFRPFLCPGTSNG
jgi:hypothetical protein